jgi:hypothetical protein
MCLLGKSRIIGTDKQREHTSAASHFYQIILAFLLKFRCMESSMAQTAGRDWQAYSKTTATLYNKTVVLVNLMIVQKLNTLSLSTLSGKRINHCQIKADKI